MNNTLTWGLVIATYQREKILPDCLRLAVEQTHKPVEVVVVDASDYWEITRDRVMTEIAAAHPEIRWVYTSAKQRGLPLQRNQGLELAKADVVFLIDDDSLMYPTCAEEIMRLYEADTEGLVQGVQATLLDKPPSNVVVTDAPKSVGWRRENPWLPVVGKVQQWIWKYVFLMDTEQLCVPYYGGFPKYEVPDFVEALNAYPIRIFHGCRMTFRRETILKERFEPLLLYYALNEDMDASYRVSRHGLLLESDSAKLHHFQSNSGRLSRFTVTVLSAMNQAACIRRYSDNLKRDRLRFYILTCRRIVAELFKDALSRRWSLPQMRGVLVALQISPTMFALSDEELADWYPRFQEDFVATGKVPVVQDGANFQTAKVSGT
jgi:glycosyltransferase involved in cell wall biosynthesis